MRKRIAVLLAALAVVLGIAIPQALAANEPQGSATMQAEWADSGNSIKLSVTATHDGTAYWVVKNATDVAPTAESVVTDGNNLTTYANQTVSGTSQVTSQAAKTIYVVLQDMPSDSYSGGQYSMVALNLSNYTTSATPDTGMVAGSGAVNFAFKQESDNAGTLSALSTVNGAVRYLIQDSNAAAPSVSDVQAGGTELATTANSTATANITVSGDQTIYLTFDDTNGNNYGLTSISVSAPQVTGKATAKAQWKDSSTITVTASATASGTLYYAVQDGSTSNAPSQETLINKGTQISLTTANQEFTSDVSGQTNTDKRIYYVYVPDGGNASAVAYVDLNADNTASYSVAIDHTALAFGNAFEDYTQPNAMSVTITNNSTRPLTFTTGTDSSIDDYTISGLPTETVAANGGTATFTVQPNAGLA